MAANTPRPSKAERSADAREQARKLQEQRAAAAKRKSLFIKLGVVVAVVAIIGIIAAIVFQNSNNDVPDAGPAPRGGNADGGIVLVSDTELGGTGGATVDVASLGPAPTTTAPPEPRGVAKAPAGEPAQIVVYVDVNCVHCAEFETAYADQLKTWLAAGDATVEYRNVAYLDRSSPTNYSSRGANALACVADAAPASYLPFTQAVFAHHAQGEMSNDELAQLASDNGADVGSCIEDGTFRPFAKFTQESARRDQIPGTPSVWVQGEVWNPETDPDFAGWAQGLIDAA
ncbi:DsbA family protein [Arthrobacter halodurans]|uniref:DsbA family protein n=1 Tax=Arthrobacter halodurans TaxID=516699 RepID=A0ABV4UPT4_9MICC